MRYSKDEKSLIYGLVGEGLTPSKISRKLREKGYRRTAHNLAEWIRYNIREGRSNQAHRPFLVFGDTHAPYQHRSAIEFLQSVKRKYNVRDHVYCVGDLFDFHSMSRHTTELDAPNSEDEYERALDFADRLADVFPMGTLVLGNHDQIPQRQMREAGISDMLLKGYNRLYGLPSGWEIEPLYTVIKETDTLIEHGIGSNGVNGAINTAIAKESNYAQGHTHSYAGAFIRSNHRGLRWALNTGCLIDNTSLAMRYGRYMKHKGVLGCGLVWASENGIAEHPQFVPMNPDHYRAINQQGK